MAEETTQTTPSTESIQPAPGQPASAQPANSVYHIVAFTFPGEHRAEEVMKTARSFAADAGMKVVASAVVEVNEKGKTKVHQPGRGGVGTTAGLLTGGLLGLIGGPAGLLVWAAGGALIGGIAGKHLGRVLPQDALEELGQQMAPNSSAILIIVQDRVAEAAIDEMKGYNAQIVTLTVGDQLSGEIAQYVAGQASGPEGEGPEGTGSNPGQAAEPAEPANGQAKTA